MTRLLIHASILICSLVLHPPAGAHLKNPTAAQGSISVQMSDDDTYTVTLSEAAFIFGDEFSLDEDESIVFCQPSSQSIAIIEVIGNKPSELLGTLKSNGNIFLVNSHGILIGENGYIDSYGFLASALPACPCPLFEGEKDVFMQGDTMSSVINRGRIKAWENNIYLVGYQIRNDGVIDASQGIVAIAAGQDLVLHPSNGHTVGVFPSSLKMENEETGIDNSGAIIASRIELKADGNAYGIGIRHGGLLDNNGTNGRTAETFLAVEKGNVVITGAIASENPDGTGGKIHILGEQVFLFENSSVDASGDRGGGNIWIGSANSETYPNAIEAKWVFIDEETSVVADAIESGDGGAVSIKSKEAVCFYGAISACGGENLGNGGLIEIFAGDHLKFEGETDLMAPNGIEGMLYKSP